MKKSTIRRTLTYLRPYKFSLGLAFFFALLSVPLILLFPILIGRAIDHAVGAGNVDFPAILRILIYALIAICSAASLTWGMQVLTRKISAAVAQDMRAECFARINAAPLSHLDRHSHGDLASRLVGDADAVAEGLLQALSQLLPGVVTILATMVAMCLLDIWIALIVILVTPLSILFARFVGTRAGKYFREQTRSQGKITGFVSEMVGNLSLVQAFDFEEKSAEEFSEIVDEYYDANFNATLYSSVINPGARFVNAIVYAAVGVFGALSAITGGITVGGISVFLSYASQYTRPFNEVTAVLTQMQTAIAGAERIFEVIDWQIEPPDAPDGSAPQSSEGHVRLENVSFSYRKDRPLIREFNLDAAPGQRIALVGPTGCGKTTLINLLMRFYDVDSGTIFVDGEPITHMKRDALRGLYGMVLQETWLKQATVRENIAYARPDATDEEVEQAAKTALAHRFIRRLPRGYDTVISEGGGDLSAGQRQLLCIARIVLANPDILILDEATSSIDTRTEIAIQKAMENLMRGHTSFIVAHRLSTIQNADLILVMKDGQIIERGTHEKLLSNEGFYSKLFHSQFDRD